MINLVQLKVMIPMSNQQRAHDFAIAVVQLLIATDDNVVSVGTSIID